MIDWQWKLFSGKLSCNFSNWTSILDKSGMNVHVGQKVDLWNSLFQFISFIPMKLSLNSRQWATGKYGKITWPLMRPIAPIVCDSTSQLNRSHNSSSKRPWGTIRTPCTYLAPLRFITGVLRSKMTMILPLFCMVLWVFGTSTPTLSVKQNIFVHLNIQTLC